MTYMRSACNEVLRGTSMIPGCVQRDGLTHGIVAAHNSCFSALRRRAVEFERPIVTVDIVLLTLRDGVLHAGLAQRDKAPALGADRKSVV